MGGSIIFVVNGKSSDYGNTRLAFSRMIGKKYIFTYEELKDILKNKEFREYTLPSEIIFSSYEDLFEALRLSFDAYPEEYEKSKGDVIKYLKENIKRDKFRRDQKIIEVQK